jgi:tripartite-type tricarboxylate transporter receptor subunit TctC
MDLHKSLGRRQLEKRLGFSVLTAAALALIFLVPVQAQSAGEFYRGKAINLVIGFSVGGGYDLYARVLARYMSKHIPGNPTIVPQNMTGAGSMRAAQYIYSVAPKDGLTFGSFSRMAAVNPLVDEHFQFDGTKFSWLGSVTNDVTACMTWHTSPVKTYKDFSKNRQFWAHRRPAPKSTSSPASTRTYWARRYASHLAILAPTRSC